MQKYLFWISIFWMLGPQAVAQSAPDSLLMAVMGDSISAGTFSDIPLQTNWRWPWRHRSQVILNEILADDGLVNSQAIFENRVRLSWASGRAITSHFRLLSEYLAHSGETRPLRVLNVAIPGSRTKNMADQAGLVVSAMTSEPSAELTYLTLMIGANDACQATELEQMRKELLETFRILSTIKQDKLRILLVSIPRIPELGTSDIRRARSLLFGIRCETLRRKIFRSCRKLLNWSTGEEYQARLKVVEDRNQILEAVATEATALHPNLEIVYTDILFDLDITAKMLALDCFHPSKFGQEQMAVALWPAQPWFK